RAELPSVLIKDQQSDRTYLSSHGALSAHQVPTLTPDPFLLQSRKPNRTQISSIFLVVIGTLGGFPVTISLFKSLANLKTSLVSTHVPFSACMAPSPTRARISVAFW